MRTFDINFIDCLLASTNLAGADMGGGGGGGRGAGDAEVSPPSGLLTIIFVKYC